MTKTKFLLWCGVLAGPVYILESIFQILTQEGFDVTRHSWSILSNGELGWLHILNFLTTGALTILGAIGISNVIKNKKENSWAVKWMMVYGFFLFLAGIFKADPVDGFPPGIPLGPPTSVSTSGILHLVFGALGFVALVTACILFSKYFKKVKDHNFSIFSKVTGIYFLIGFLSLMGGGAFGATGMTIAILAFTVAVILSWTWYSLLSWKLLKSNS